MSGRLPLVTKALLPHTQTSTILFRAHTIIIIGPLGHNSVRNTSPALVVRGETANVTRSIMHTFSPEQVQPYFVFKGQQVGNSTRQMNSISSREI